MGSFVLAHQYCVVPDEYFEWIVADTSGNDEFKEITGTLFSFITHSNSVYIDKEIKEAQGFILMYSVDNK